VTALPFYLSPIGMSIADAFFESMSGWTTTGSTVLTSLDTLPASILLWRSMLQWFGGVGIISVGLLLLPFLRIGGVQIFQMESSEKSDKPLAQIIQYASAIALSYLALSLACLLAFYFGGMQFPDAVNHMMATICGSPQDFPGNWRAMRIYIVKGIAESSIKIMAIHAKIGTESTFAVVSIITTTGFSYGDYTLWGSLVVGVIFMLMFVGGCTGSTSGGIKVYRWIILFQSLRNYLARLLHRQGVFQIRYNETTLEQSSCHAVLLFINVYLLTLVFITILLAATGLDILTSFTAAIATLGNVGPVTGSLIVETLFSLDGLGLLGFESIINRDYPVVFGTLYVFSLIGLVVNLISDLVYVWIDPRISFRKQEA
jgi:trk system potassium uptake protein TrkH